MSGAKSCYKPRANAKTMVYLPEHNIVSSNVDGVKLYFQLTNADKGVATAAVNEWKAKKDEMDSKKSSRSPRSKGEPVKLPPGARPKKETSPARMRSPRSPAARSPRGGYAMPDDVVGRPASPDASPYRPGSARPPRAASPRTSSRNVASANEPMPEGGVRMPARMSSASGRRPASPSGSASRRSNRLERM